MARSGVYEFCSPSLPTSMCMFARSYMITNVCAKKKFHLVNLFQGVAWFALEWILMTVSILASFNSINLALVSGRICSGMIKAIQGAGIDTDNLLEKVAVGIGHNQQPMYFQLQRIYVAAQQQQQTNAKLTYAGGQTQYPQQVLYPQLQESQFLQPTPDLQIAPPIMQQAPMVYSHQPQWPQQGPVAHQKNPNQSQSSQLE